MSDTPRIKAYIERILRLKAEQDTIGEDVREIYAEAKANGFDKTALGSAVTIVRKREKHGTAAVEEQSAIVDLYLSAYDGTGNATRARARETDNGGGAAPDSNSNAPPATPATSAAAASSNSEFGSLPIARIEPAASRLCPDAPLTSNSMGIDGAKNRVGDEAASCELKASLATRNQSSGALENAGGLAVRIPSALPPRSWSTPALIEVADDPEGIPTFLLRGHPDCKFGGTAPPEVRPP